MPETKCLYCNSDNMHTHTFLKPEKLSIDTFAPGIKPGLRVVCFDCGASGPLGQDDAEAWKLFDKGPCQ